MKCENVVVVYSIMQFVHIFNVNCYICVEKNLSRKLWHIAYHHHMISIVKQVAMVFFTLLLGREKYSHNLSLLAAVMSKYSFNVLLFYPRMY
jgi:hypothetical protein